MYVMVDFMSKKLLELWETRVEPDLLNENNFY